MWLWRRQIRISWSRWMKRMSFKIAFQTMKFWFWIYSLWVPESSIWCFVSMRSLHGLIFVCMKWASNGPGALWLFTAFWDQCVCGSFFELWQKFLSNSVCHQWVGRKGRMVTAQPGILWAGSASSGCAGSQHNGFFQCQALLTVFGSSCLNFPWCSLHTGVTREWGTSSLAIMYCSCMLAWVFSWSF